MTYLEAVNSVLRRLREREVSSVSESAYSKLIGDFVNDARNEVETAWGWSGLRTTLTLTTVADIFNYELNGTQNNFTILDVINDTADQFMEYRPGTWFDNAFLTQGSVKGSPEYYNFNGVANDGDTQVDIYPIPDAVYIIRFNVILRNIDMSADGDKLYIPTRPVILLALAKAIEERGEDGGNASMNAYAAGRSSLADEIALDAARRPDETIWYPV